MVALIHEEFDNAFKNGTPDAAEAKKIAEDNFEYWFESAGEFRQGFRDAFDHKTHNIEKLRGYAASLVPDLVDARLRFHRRDRQMFDLLRRARVEARYSRNYRITREELEWLEKRADVLTGLVHSASEQQTKRPF